jgi:mannose-6-phosphate isomerase-like protein (cupin superfamily)
LDRVIRGEDFTGDSQPDEQDRRGFHCVKPRNRRSIELASGVKWEDLTATSDEELDFVLATYEVGGASTPDGSLMRHHGREYGYVLSGTLGVQIGFKDYELHRGDSIAFDSTRPHRLYNKGDTPVQAIWFVVDLKLEDGVASR